MAMSASMAIKINELLELRNKYTRYAWAGAGGTYAMFPDFCAM